MAKDVKPASPDGLRRSIVIGGAATLAVPRIALGQGSNVVRIGVPTKTYWPTILVETALRHKLFEKEGIKAELTIYRSGAEGFEAIAAGAADLVMNSTMSVAAGLKKGVKVRCVANGANGYYGWYLVVRQDSKVTNPAELGGKKVGITSAGSGTDILARWAQNAHKVKFNLVPLGGGGLVPNLLTGNIDGSVLYSPLTYQVMKNKEARPLVDFGSAVEPHSTGSWIATDTIIRERPQALQSALNAIYGGVAFLQDDKNHDAAVKLIAEIDEIPPDIAAAELKANIKNLSSTGEFKPEWVERALGMARLIGMTDLAPASEIYTTKFRPRPTKA